MPTISVDKEDLYSALGKQYTTEEFEELCFEFGIELDQDTSLADPATKGLPERPVLKIEVPANRYDLLCFEGIARALNTFVGREKPAKFNFTQPEKPIQFVVRKSTAVIRPYAAAAILRGITFTERRYASFIALQDKLHTNLARNRSLVAIGTHDLSTIKGPFSYEALPPTAIKFVPLNQKKEMNGYELMEFYKNDLHLGKFLHLVRDSEVFPVIYDAERRVCSLPPIINSNLSKITVNTRDVFIECTATDKTKLEIVINIMVSMFSSYCENPFSIEPVEIISPHNNCSRISPSPQTHVIPVEVSYVNSCCGVSLSATDICSLLTKMSLHAQPCATDLIEVQIPLTRGDVLHQCDIMEDVAIAYGYDKLSRTFPDKSATIGQPLAINKLSDIVRLEAALAGWTEVMPLILCSHAENFDYLRRKDQGQAVKLANPKTWEYQVVRTSLLPGILKTIRENRERARPIKIFEVSDVVLQDENLERKAKNVRRFGAVWCGKTSGFEYVHGLLDRVMAMLGEKLINKKDSGYGYWIDDVDGKHDTYFPGRSATVHLRSANGTLQIGSFGILHPKVLESFEVTYPCSSLEIDLECFL